MRRPRVIILLALAIAYGCGSSNAPARGVNSARVTHVFDGDTLVVRLSDQTTPRIRLFGVDAPEMSQPFGEEARAFTISRVLNQAVEIENFDRDIYGRTVAKVFYDDTELGLELVSAGMAWMYRSFTNDPELDERESEARAYRRGLWSQSQPEPPWAFRR